MNFEFDEEQYLLRDSVRGVLSQNWSIAKLRRAIGGSGHDAELWGALSELGLFQAPVPEAEGGLGLDFLSFALVFEELGRRLAPGDIAQTILAVELAFRFGDGAQKQRIAETLANGQPALAIAFQEPDRGFGPEEIAAKATAETGGWRLDGQKTLVPYASYAANLLVAARTDTGDLRVFLCDPRAAGVTLRQNETIDPSYRAYDVAFSNVWLAPTDVLPERGDTGAAQQLHQLCAVVAALEMIGCASAALDMAVEYAKQRQQFGRPIGSFQAIKHKCADMFMALETARSAAYFAAWALSGGDSGAGPAASMAKALAGDACRLVCNEAHQIHGGIGFTWEYDLHFFIKRGKFLEYAYGDASWHREQLIAHAIEEARAV
ncbi:acyl-CoA dehydrogenase [Methylovirgula ligni]|uniref:Acyl-CoA dehydrogenase n=1 Tax=Methylovirgula ligni TaxID=569860 RepID=A0A3D9Z221_9HYPH|nr:acyl-CoA dehydrogenase family protein [Methylovirgula ligni]QAY95490.1 acyl-CoA dehydrogenase [Methylovirgula ligni]REF89177.1 acyl-CoA dehydrogenase [Methylovirgula ligni]